MSEAKVTLTDHETGKSYELPVYKGTYGSPLIDITGLNKETGFFTYDPGFMSTASCRSDITYLDGAKGELMYRGYPIEQLAEKCTFMEVFYLLLYGELPDTEQLAGIEQEVAEHTILHESLLHLFQGFHYDAHPMAILTGVVGSLSAFYNNPLDISNPEHRIDTAYRIIAKLPTIAAATYKHNVGERFTYASGKMSYCGRFLHMMFSRSGEDYEVDPIAEKALDVLFVLHADHEQNASTSTVRLAGSSDTNPYAAIAAGIASLWGPTHGGANEAVLKMLRDIGDVKNIDKYIARAKDKNDPFRLMGFGHRVYKNFDPRAKIIKNICYQVMEKYGNDPRMELAMKLEEIALKDEYFIKRGLYPNVDFYSGIIYSALGFPEEMFTVLFTIGRVAGWMTHWIEMISEPHKRIGRPRQYYSGPARRDVPR
jgi:citrate synthase